MAVHHVDQRPMVHHYSQVSHEVHVVTMEGMLSRTYIELFFSMPLLFKFCVQLEFALLSESLSDVFCPDGILKVITAQAHNTLFSSVRNLVLTHAFWTLSACLFDDAQS